MTAAEPLILVKLPDARFAVRKTAGDGRVDVPRAQQMHAAALDVLHADLRPRLDLTVQARGHLVCAWSAEGAVEQLQLLRLAGQLGGYRRKEVRRGNQVRLLRDAVVPQDCERDAVGQTIVEH